MTDETDYVDMRPRHILSTLGVFCAVLTGLALYACATAPDPRAALYGVEWARCASDYDAAAEARACMRAVNTAYGRDGGVR